MTDAEDWNATQVRDEEGYPVASHGPNTRNSARHSVAPGANSWVHQTTDNSQNKALPWIIVSCIIGTLGLALGITSLLAAQKAEREARLMSFYILELDSKLIAAGFKTDAEALAKRFKEREE